MVRKKNNKIWLKVILPLLIIGGMIGLFLSYQGNLSSEIAVDYTLKPWFPEKCKINEHEEKIKNSKE